MALRSRDCWHRLEAHDPCSGRECTPGLPTFAPTSSTVPRRCGTSCTCGDQFLLVRTVTMMSRQIVSRAMSRSTGSLCASSAVQAG